MKLKKIGLTSILIIIFLLIISFSYSQVGMIFQGNVYGPEKRLIPQFIYTVDSTPNAGDSTHLVKRSFSTLNEDSRVNIANILAGGISAGADISYIQTLGSGAPPTWNVTYGMNPVYALREGCRLAVDTSTNTFFVSIGNPVWGNIWWVIKRSLVDGSAIGTWWAYNEVASCVSDIFVYGDSFYVLGVRRFADVARILKVNKTTLITSINEPINNLSFWHGSLFVDDSGVYLVIFEVATSDWRIEKRDFGLNLIWGQVQSYLPANNQSFGITGDDTYIYIVGGGDNWVIEKRLKTNGNLITGRVYNPAPGMLHLLFATMIPYENRLYIGGSQAAQTATRIERVLQSTFATDGSSTSAVAKSIRKMDRDAGDEANCSVLIAVPTYNAGTGAWDILMQRRKCSTLGF